MRDENDMTTEFRCPKTICNCCRVKTPPVEGKLSDSGAVQPRYSSYFPRRGQRVPYLYQVTGHYCRRQSLLGVTILRDEPTWEWLLSVLDTQVLSGSGVFGAVRFAVPSLGDAYQSFGWERLLSKVRERMESSSGLAAAG